MKTISKLLTLLIWLISSPGTSGQDSSVFLHIDRSYYLPGELIFFRAYFLNGQNNKKVTVDDTLHLALLDQFGVEVASGLFPIDKNMINGNIDLPDFLTEGNYILIAYTKSMKNLTPDKNFSRIIEIRKPMDDYLIANLSLSDDIYEPAGQFSAQIRFSIKDNMPVPASYSYQLIGNKEEILNGNNKANSDGIANVKFRLPKFDNNETLKLIVVASSKGAKNITGVFLPTLFNSTRLKTKPAENPSVNELKHLNIQLRAINATTDKNDKVQMEISVTDDKGNPAMADLSVSVSNLLQHQLPAENDNILSVHQRNYMPEAGSNTDIKEYFTEYLIQKTQSPGTPFIVQEKNNVKKLHKLESAANKKNQIGYSSDRSVFDILMSIKPYHIDNGKIIFSSSAMNSINNPDCALIIVDGIKLGTDASILNSISVPDIAKITASTNVMDIQRYTAMNCAGIIEITIKKSKEYLKNEENSAKPKSNTLFWGSDIMTDNTGKATFSFYSNGKTQEVLISVNGLAANGECGSSTIQYSVK
jgi:hypothetical protein